MRRTVVAMAMILSLTHGRGTIASGPDQITGATAMAVRSWVAAVRSHAPGRRDAAAGQISALTFDQRVELNPGVLLFLNALQGQRVVTNSVPQKDIFETARQTRLNPGVDVFLKRAAVLHGDAALLNELDERGPADPAGAPSGTSESPLLTRHNLFLDKDGEIKGEVLADWNWPFARSLLDLLSPRPADDPFVGTWYHATTAFMLKKGLYGEAVTHLARAAEVLGDDALALFDRACYSEIQGLPVTQVLLSEADLITLRAQRQGRRSSIRTPTDDRPFQLGIPAPEAANDEAERLFRRALRVDPQFVEARVRLARLLEERSRYQEAAAELSTVFAAKPTGPVAFYAHLFAGRAAQGLGRIDEAAGHYREASALFPGAQSARLALSQAALLGADVPATLEPIEHLDKSSSAHDPWWQYHLAAGRDADDILRDMWSKVAKF
jgi:tetratricopeptide (TPR) repeat protein